MPGDGFAPRQANRSLRAATPSLGAFLVSVIVVDALIGRRRDLPRVPLSSAR
jgi:hypothetical protein